MKNTIRIAVVQHKYQSRDYGENTKDGLRLMEQAAEMGADIVLFPECFLTGYELPITNREAIADDSEYLQNFCQKAAQLKVGAVITAFTRGEEKPWNSAFVIDKEGTVLMKYNKVHTCDFADEACLESGDQFYVCDFEGVKIGVMICYDREYPESARLLMLKGAELILVPNDCTLMEPRVQALSTRAYENMTGVVMANPPGKQGGRSCAFSPVCWDEEEHCVDNTVLMCDEMTDGIFIAEYNLNKLRHYREHEMMGNTFRKVKAYAKLLEDVVEAPFLRS